MYGTTEQFREALTKTSGLSDADRFDIERQIQAAEADDLRMGSQMLSATAGYLRDQYDDISAEIREVSEGFQAVSSYAGRPDVGPGEISAVFSDLDKRARVVNARLSSWEQQVAEYKERKANPAAYVSDLRTKWASKAITQADRFLHQVSGL